MIKEIPPLSFWAKLKKWLVLFWNDYQKLSKNIGYAILIATFIVLPIGAILLLLKAWLTGWQVDTQIRADFSVDEFTFTLEQKAITQPMRFESITVHKFKQIDFSPTVLANQGDNSIQASAIAKPLEIRPKEGENYNATLTTGSELGAFGKLERLSINPGTTVSVKIHPDVPKRLTIKLTRSDNQDILSEPVLLMFGKRFKLKSKNNRIDPEVTQENIAELEAKLSEIRDPYVSIIGQPHELELSLVTSSQKPFPLFVEDAMQIRDSKLFIEKFDFNEAKVRIKSTLTQEGTISFIGFYEKKEIPFNESDLVLIGHESELVIEKAIFDFRRKEISLRLQGIVTELKIKSPLFPDQGNRDYRVTLYDKLEEHKLAKSIFESIEWLILGIIAVAGIILVEKFQDLFRKDK